MTTYRNELPQLSNHLFLTDGGLETTLVFKKGYDLPEFAAFDLLSRKGGYETLRDYYLPYLDIARTHKAGFILESPTWRASRDWGRKLGYSPADLRSLNRQAIAMMRELRTQWAAQGAPIVISGCIGPRGDGYVPGARMTVDESGAYHLEQIEALGDAGADLISAMTINYVEEAIGITRAAQSTGIPVVIGFTVETDGKLPSGQPLGQAIDAVDAATNSGPAYYMINCAHPTHFSHVLPADKSWTGRIRAVRANASIRSHAELDQADELDAGDPVDLGARNAALKALLPSLNIFGGCCGTDHRHVEEICKAVGLN